MQRRPVMHYFFLERFSHPADWFEKRLAYTRSVAASSMVCVFMLCILSVKTPSIKLFRFGLLAYRSMICSDLMNSSSLCIGWLHCWIRGSAFLKYLDRSSYGRSNSYWFRSCIWARPDAENTWKSWFLNSYIFCHYFPYLSIYLNWSETLVPRYLLGWQGI